MKLKIFRNPFFILGIFAFFIFLILFLNSGRNTGQTSFLIINEYNEVWQIGHDDKEKQLTDNGHYKSHLKVFSNGEKFGYFQELHKRDEYFDYQDEQARKEYYENYLALMIYDLESKTEKEVFRGNNRLSGWEWINDKEVVIYQSCGTECVGFWRIDIETGEKNSGNYGVDYQWSPDKKYLLAYRYTFCGIAIGDKYGNEIFEVMRDENEIFPSLAEKTKAIWSPDSSKFALIIKKDAQEKLELLAFDVLNNFKIIYQKDLEANDFSDFFWENNRAVYYNINGEMKKIVIE